MSKERELLAVALDFINTVGWGEIDGFAVVALSENIKELLAQPEQEPDLWVVTNPWGVNEYLWSEPREQVYENYKVTKFYRLPLPTREPLSDNEIIKLWANKSPMNEFECVRLIEKTHSITGVDDEH